MVINTNTSADAAALSLQSNQPTLAQSISQLSSILESATPSSDTADLTASTGKNSQINGLNAANASVANAMSFTQTQNAYLQKVGTALGRMSELSSSALDTTKTDADRAQDSSEFQALSAYVSNVGTQAFNGVSLFSAAPITVTTATDSGVLTLAGIDLNGAGYAGATSADIGTVPDATAALTAVKTAIDQVTTDRAMIGANQARLDTAADQLTVTAENLNAASSQLKDPGAARKSVNYAQQNMMAQPAAAMLAQANQLPETVARLLQ
jgi:flagellin